MTTKRKSKQLKSTTTNLIAYNKHKMSQIFLDPAGGFIRKKIILYHCRENKRKKKNLKIAIPNSFKTFLLFSFLIFLLTGNEHGLSKTTRSLST